MTLVHARPEEGSTESDQDRRLINTRVKCSLKTKQLSWNLEDEKKFVSQRGEESSRRENQLVSRYKRSWCIQVFHSRMSNEVPCREQIKRVRERNKGLFRRQSGMGQLWGDQSDLYAHFVPLSLTISMNRCIIACYGDCEAIVDTRTSLILDPRRLISNILRLIGTTSRGSEVKGHTPGSLSVSIQNKDLQGQSLPLSLTGLRFMFCSQ